MFATDRSCDVATLAREAESRGFVSVYLPEHTHIPTSRATPAPTGDAELPEQYRRTLDPLVALASAATVTKTIRLGTGVCLVAQHDPIVLAKAVATLDWISAGRFVLGIGFGWNREEMADHGVDFPTRRDLVREKVLVMQSLWAEEEASMAGRLVSLQKSWAWPKPVQSPWPPILLGGAPGPKLFRHIVEYCDGWIPIGGAGVKAAIAELRRVAEEAGRDPQTLRIVPFGTVPDARKLDYYASFGIEEVVLQLPSAPRDKILRVLDDFVRFL